MTHIKPARLRIAVVGAGRIGSAFAFQLVQSGGHEITVVARSGSDRLRTLRRDQAIINVHGERASVTVCDVLDEATPYDLVIVTLLAHQADAILPALQRSAARCIQFMFNTFDPEHVETAIGIDRCAFGMPFIQSRLDADGRLDVTIGAGGQKTLMSDRRWVEVFKTAGLPAAIEPDMKLWLRCHAPLCIAFESVSIAAMRRGGGASWDEAMILARGVKAGFGLIRSLGQKVHPGSKRWLDRSPVFVMAGMLWSLSRIAGFREVLATGEAECEALVAELVASSRTAGQLVDVSRILAMSPSRMAPRSQGRDRGAPGRHPPA
ncbi:ketopantoate reductase family protein [Brevundimonas sp.]|uniref:ketopantoate reductase family protein n=1 Tax=Brevundimonas sp. TaxID=1871086 RepID=UPI0035613017